MKAFELGFEATSTRRDFLRRSVLLGSGALALSGGVGVSHGLAQEAPRKGGLLRIGIGGGSTSDTLDPRLLNDMSASTIAAGLMNPLIELGPKFELNPLLAESWEVKNGAVEWVFNLRKGVSFSNGKEFNADDAIYSLNLHRGETTSSQRSLMQNIENIAKTDTHQFVATLRAPDADLAYVLANKYILMVPNGFTAWSAPIGTGAFTLESWEPGIKAALNGKADYWRPNRGHLERAEVSVINDSTARLTAFLSGQIDFMNFVPASLVAAVKARPDLVLAIVQTSIHDTFAMRFGNVPFDNLDYRLALKYAIDRGQVLDTALNGFGTLGNDHPVAAFDPFFNHELPQRPHDPDKAAFYFKKSGVTQAVKLKATVSDTTGGIDGALVFQENANKAGIPFEVEQVPVDGYWSDVWQKTPFFLGSWAGRPATQALGLVYKSGSPQNETNYSSEKFDSLLADAKRETDVDKRRAYVWAMQELLSNEGGVIIPYMKDMLEAHTSKVGGYIPHAAGAMSNYGILDQVWIDG